MENIAVYAMDGKQMAAESEAHQQFSMDVSTWSSGTYVFSCEINGTPTQKTFVKCD
jgi:hypothetical protein